MTDHPLLYTMLDDMDAAPEIYQPTAFWRPGIRDIVGDIETFGLDTFRRHASALQFYFPSYAEPGYILNNDKYPPLFENLKKLNLELDELAKSSLERRHELLADYRVFCAADTNQAPDLSTISESEYGSYLIDPIVDERRLGQGMLNYLRGLAFLKKSANTSGIRQILEIGGGFGTLGEIMLKSPSHPYFYVDIDLPPLSYVATHYLKQVFGEHAVADYSLTRHMDVIDVASLEAQGYRAVVLCPWQIDRLQGSFELFYNSISFQEMEPHVVQNYASHVDRLVTDFLIIRASRHGKAIHGSETTVEEPIGRDDYLDIFQNWERFGLDSLTFGYQTGRGFESEVHLYRKHPDQ